MNGKTIRKLNISRDEMPSLSNYMTLLHKLIGPNTWESWPGSWLNVPVAWEEATQEQRNKLLRHLLEEVWIKDKRIVAVRPRPEMEPFFRLSFEEWVKEHGEFEVEAPIPVGVASNIFRLTLQV